MLEIVKKGIVAYYPLIKKAQKRATELYSVGRNVNSVCNFYSEITGTKTVKFAPPPIRCRKFVNCIREAA